MNVMGKYGTSLKTHAYFLRFGGDGVLDLNRKIEKN
jgi:hypothetical protein